MRLLFEKEAHLVGYHLRVTLYDTGEVHERIGHLPLLIDHPRLPGLAQEPLQPFADNGAADI